ncbi:MAG: hypothetical protein RL641_637 [Candidatus Parcubacteria bacterium]|jgi:hypothetical protein
MEKEEKIWPAKTLVQTMTQEEKEDYLVNQCHISKTTLNQAAQYIDLNLHPHISNYENYVGKPKEDGSPLRLAVKPHWKCVVRKAFRNIVGMLPDKEHQTFFAFMSIMQKYGKEIRLERDKLRAEQKTESKIVRANLKKNQSAFSLSLISKKKKASPSIFEPGYIDPLLEEIRVNNLHMNSYF